MHSSQTCLQAAKKTWACKLTSIPDRIQGGTACQGPCWETSLLARCVCCGR